MKVVLCQCPWGTTLRQRWPRRQRPYRRASLVFKPVSSIKTKRLTSQSGCWLRQSTRACLTSGRSCSAARVVFFKAQTQTTQTMPQSRNPNGDLELFGAPLLQLGQRQIWGGFNPAMERSVISGQPGAAITTNLFRQTLPRAAMLVPKPFHALTTDTKPFADLPGSFPAFPRGNNPPPEILA